MEFNLKVTRNRHASRCFSDIGIHFVNRRVSGIFSQFKVIVSLGLRWAGYKNPYLWMILLKGTEKYTFVGKIAKSISFIPSKVVRPSVKICDGYMKVWQCLWDTKNLYYQLFAARWSYGKGASSFMFVFYSAFCGFVILNEDLIY